MHKLRFINFLDVFFDIGLLINCSHHILALLIWCCVRRLPQCQMLTTFAGLFWFMWCISFLFFWRYWSIFCMI
ncbi:hypothetical protein Hanom_Chr14g01263311 [Helianthus anomalus]